MADEPYYTPGQSDGVPPQSPTQFGPEKPLGPDPVSPMPLPEGSEVDRHAQVMAFDPVSGQFKPVGWKDGKMLVDATLVVGDIEIGAVELKNRDSDDRQIVFPDGSAQVAIFQKILGFPIGTVITRDANGLVSQIVENDGMKTKTTTITRDADQNVASIAEAIA